MFYPLITLIAIKITWLFGFVISYAAQNNVSGSVVSLIITTAIFDTFKNCVMYSGFKKSKERQGKEKYLMAIVCFWMIGTVPCIAVVSILVLPETTIHDIVIASNLIAIYAFDAIYYYIMVYCSNTLSNRLFKRYLTEDGKCAVCLTNDASVSGDCGHVCLCDNCQYQIDQCPMCRTAYDTKYRVIPLHSV